MSFPAEKSAWKSPVFGLSNAVKSTGMSSLRSGSRIPWLYSFVYFSTFLLQCLFSRQKARKILVQLFFSDFAEPLAIPGYGGAGASVYGATGLDNQPPEEIVAIITSMGFQRNQAVQALRATVSIGDYELGNSGLAGGGFSLVLGNRDLPVSFGHSKLFLTVSHHTSWRFFM